MKLALAILFAIGGLGFLFGWQARLKSTEQLVAILNVAGLDGSENGQRVAAQVASSWGGTITNVAVINAGAYHYVRSDGTKGTRLWGWVP